jgi:hypothetical protein
MDKPQQHISIQRERGQKDDEMGNLKEDTSINLLIQKQLDFMSELTLLQYHGAKLGQFYYLVQND